MGRGRDKRRCNKNKKALKEEQAAIKRAKEEPPCDKPSQDENERR